MLNGVFLIAEILSLAVYIVIFEAIRLLAVGIYDGFKKLTRRN